MNFLQSRNSRGSTGLMTYDEIQEYFNPADVRDGDFGFPNSDNRSVICNTTTTMAMTFIVFIQKRVIHQLVNLISWTYCPLRLL